MIIRKLNNRDKLILAGIIAFLSAMLLILVMISSSNETVRFFGHFLSVLFMAMVMLGLGISQFIPRIFKGRKWFSRTAIWMLAALWIFMAGIFCTALLPEYLEDMPYVIKKEYSFFEGQLRDFRIVKGKTKSTYFTLDDQTFHISGVYDPGVLVIGHRYRVEYLPKTKEIMGLYKLN